MSEAICAALLALAFLSVKHTFCDFFLQTTYQFSNKGTYGHLGGVLHAGLHALFTLPVFLILPPASILVGAMIIVGEFVIHYHLDWSKEQLVSRFGLGQADSWFWHLFGLDQLGHILTYIVIVAILLK